MMSAFAKIPLQALILLTGVLVFVFYLFTEPPMLFNSVHESQVRASSRGAEYARLETDFHQAFERRREAADNLAAARGDAVPTTIASATDAFVESNERLEDVRERAATLVQDVTGDRAYTDVNYVFPRFVTTELPVGLVGLMIAAIFAAAMSSIAAELNSLSTVTVIDFYRRHLKTAATDRHYLTVSKVATGFWGLFASGFALYAPNLGSLIEVVNRVGSYFYGSLLGVFVLAVGVRRATARGAFWGLIAGMLVVAAAEYTTSVSFLWLNVIGASAVVVVGMALSHGRPH